MILGIRVVEDPWGPPWLPVGPSELGHGLPESPQMLLFRCLVAPSYHLEERLLDQAQAWAPHLFFWGHWRTIPRGMTLDVQTLEEILFWETQ